MQKNSKKVLITGVAGFLGANLLERLLTEGYYVIGVDNLSQGPLTNIEGFLHHDRFKFYELDVLDSERLFAIPDGIDCVIHFAAYKIPRYDTPLKTLEINVKGTENALELARHRNARFIYGSTDEIYGKNTGVPLSEESALILGETDVNRWSFAASQMYGEHLCFAYAEKYSLPVSILRYFGGYGPKQSLGWWGGPVAVFIEAALRNTVLPIHGDGTQTRSFCYVSDMIDTTMRALESEKAIGEIINIGNPTEVSIIDLAYMIWGLSANGNKPKLEFIDYTEFSGKYEDVKKRVPDTTKARVLLGCEHEVSLVDGLKMTIQWHKKIINAT